MSEPAHFSAKRNFVFTAATTAVNLFYPLFSFAYVSRIMGPVLVGRINLATSLASYFALLASAAIPIYGARQIARVRDDRDGLDRTFSELVSINLAMTALACLLYASGFLVSAKMRSEWPLFTVSGLLILANCLSLDWYFQGIEHFPSAFLRNLCIKIASLLLMFLMVKGKEDYILFTAIGAGGGMLYSLWGLREALIRVRIRFRGLRPLSHIRPLSVLAVATMLSSAYLYLDGVLLGMMAGDHALGLYSTANRLTRTSLLVIIALTTSLIPRLSRYLESGMADEHAALAQKSIHVIYFICFPLFTMLWALAPRLISILAGAEFADASLTLRLMLPLLPLAGFTNFLGLQILFPKGHEKPLLYCAMAGAAIDLSLNVLLIPSFGPNGSAIASVATEAGVMAVLLVSARRMRFPFRLMDARGLQYLVMGTLAGAISWSVSLAPLHDIPAVGAALAAGSAFYLAALRLREDPTVVMFLDTAVLKFRATGG